MDRTNQLVGQTCIRCRERIIGEYNSRFCPTCRSPVHNACSIPTADGCVTCGGSRPPVPVAAPPTAPAGVTLGQSRTIVAGMALIVQSAVALLLGLMLLAGGRTFEIPWYSSVPALLVAPLLFWLGWVQLQAATAPKNRV